MPGFGDRIRPDQVTLAMRARLARSVYRREFLALAAVFLPCLLIAGVVIAFYHFHNEAVGTVWQVIGPIVVTGALIAVVVHAWGLRERKFVETAPLAAAVVKQIETSSDYTYKHRVILSYRPIQYKSNSDMLPGLSPAHSVVATVESNFPGFSQLLQKGDSVSIIYDPVEPDHVWIVEEEKAVFASSRNPPAVEEGGTNYAASRRCS
ncbi:MAG: hypothetical protein ROO76_16585 [Terriglobia bacterium]|jgi:hypothetical protein|nr:hypothetical protein [Terriglobia bacterium]